MDKEANTIISDRFINFIRNDKAAYIKWIYISTFLDLDHFTLWKHILYGKKIGISWQNSVGSYLL